MSSFVVGLTGGIGSGKSTVAGLFVEHGAALVDTDAIAHELTGPDGAAMAQLVAAFGPQVARPDGAMDRAAMRRLVFADPSAKAGLETILHPLIRQLSAERCRAATAPYVILAVPLLVESGSYRERCDRVLVVDCPESLQIERVVARNGMSPVEVEAIMATQASREQRLAVADDIVLNDGDLTGIYPQVIALHQKYLVLSAEKVKAGC
ncbi:dephospho-CoA kinase [Dechloromonas sp. XY25]|uniref:Dephospho-CoA kinase n=1 Tax=Dechloromonas hankyongensis TaxID=2908002 RepID=A0ABS9JWU7_9RHOO|nr:dephospho-CoA kinase [Dechloromonas hankyongensis]MCG2575377.1 dephospho-CoA kinase [Dechloromonas hankyongensis]